MSFKKTPENKKANRSCLGIGTSGRDKDIRKGLRRVVEIFCTHVCTWKNETC
jgi:hypothetical protein